MAYYVCEASPRGSLLYEWGIVLVDGSPVFIFKDWLFVLGSLILLDVCSVG